MSSIVDFPVRVPDADIFRHEETRSLYGAWLSAARRGRLPRLTEFAPARLGRWLAWCGVVEPAAGADDPAAEEAPRWRLAGSELCRLAGRDLDGEVVFARWHRFERSMLRRMILRAMRDGCPFVARLDLNMLPENREFGAEMLALPFADGEGTVVLLFFRPGVDTLTLAPARLDEARMVSLRVPDVPTVPEESREEAEAGPTAEVLPLFRTG